jgi:hypothetical protein
MTLPDGELLYGSSCCIPRQQSTTIHLSPESLYNQPSVTFATMTILQWNDTSIFCTDNSMDMAKVHVSGTDNAQRE